MQSYRFNRLLLCNSVILNAGVTFREFTHPHLAPWVHYVPLKADGSDARAVTRFLQANDGVAKAIASNAQQFAKRRLTEDSLASYWRRLLTDFAALQAKGRHKVELGDGFERVHETRREL